MKILEALNLYSLHSDPKKLAKRDQAEQMVSTTEVPWIVFAAAYVDDGNDRTFFPDYAKTQVFKFGRNTLHDLFQNIIPNIGEYPDVESGLEYFDFSEVTAGGPDDSFSVEVFTGDEFVADLKRIFKSKTPNPEFEKDLSKVKQAISKLGSPKALVIGAQEEGVITYVILPSLPLDMVKMAAAKQEIGEAMNLYKLHADPSKLANHDKAKEKFNTPANYAFFYAELRYEDEEENDMYGAPKADVKIGSGKATYAVAMDKLMQVAQAEGVFEVFETREFKAGDNVLRFVMDNVLFDNDGEARIEEKQKQKFIAMLQKFNPTHAIHCSFYGTDGEGWLFTDAIDIQIDSVLSTL